jgi:hypothetical protein
MPRRSKFEIDPHNLDKSAAAAFQAHTEKRLSYAEWKTIATRIERLKGIETFRRQHGDAPPAASTRTTNGAATSRRRCSRTPIPTSPRHKAVSKRTAGRTSWTKRA